jgi:hypothetical protein
VARRLVRLAVRRVPVARNCGWGLAWLNGEGSVGGLGELPSE